MEDYDQEEQDLLNKLAAVRVKKTPEALIAEAQNIYDNFKEYSVPVTVNLPISVNFILDNQGIGYYLDLDKSLLCHPDDKDLDLDQVCSDLNQGYISVEDDDGIFDLDESGDSLEEEAPDIKSDWRDLLQNEDLETILDIVGKQREQNIKLFKIAKALHKQGINLWHKIKK